MTIFADEFLRQDRDNSATRMTWETIWTTVGWGAPEFREGLRAGAQIMFYSLAMPAGPRHADQRQLALLTALYWLASGGDLLNDELPAEEDVRAIMSTKDRGPYYCLIDHPDALREIVAKLCDARFSE